MGLKFLDQEVIVEVCERDVLKTLNFFAFCSLLSCSLVDLRIVYILIDYNIKYGNDMRLRGGN